jgi:hypothetical protein
VAARFLLKPGRRYEDAVKTFEPYDRVKEENPEARAAATALIEEGKKAGPARKTFVFVNSRLEGNALTTFDFAEEPSAGVRPVVVGRASGNPKNFGGLL